MSQQNRIFLSPPHIGDKELELIQEAFHSNYIAPLGPMVDAFEKEFTDYVGIGNCVAVASGTAAMHLALMNLGIGECDEVIASTLTFIGSITPVTFLGATPVLIDCDKETWNMDPGLLTKELIRSEKDGKLPKAIIPTDLYGQCCNLPRIVEISEKYDVPVICDSAEAVGAVYLAQRRKTAKKNNYKIRGEKAQMREKGERESSQVRPSDIRHPTSDIRPVKSANWNHAGKGAKAAIYSFNGNKIITTSGGGMLASDDVELIDHARFLSQQARDPFPHYEHSEIGFNYRMSNILAAIGRGQLRVLDARVKRKRKIFEYYRNALGDLPGIDFMPEPEWSRSNRWLTVILITPKEFGSDRETIRLALEAENIESRPVWKPMHLQPVFDCQPNRGKIGKRRVHNPTSYLRPPTSMKKRRYPARAVGGEVAEDLFNRGLCLPSGTAMTESDLDRICSIIRSCHRP